MSRPVVPKVRPITTSLLLVGIFVGVTACGSTGGPPQSPQSRSSYTNITRSQILSAVYGDAHGVVRLLRPRWLRARLQATPGNPNPVYPVVYVDHLPYGTVDSLYGISTNMIERIEYLNALDATTFYGTGHMGGIIRVVTRR